MDYLDVQHKRSAQDSWTYSTASNQFKNMSKQNQNSNSWVQKPNPYLSTMTSQQKFDTFKNNAYKNVKSNLPFWAKAKAVVGIKPNQQTIDNAMVQRNVVNTADQFLNSLNMNDINYMQQNYNTMVNNMGGQTSPAGKAFANYIKSGMQSRVWQQVRQNPLKNLPMAASLWLKDKGMGTAGNLAANPMVFYGGMMAALAGGAMLWNSTDDEDKPAPVRTPYNYSNR